MYSQSHNPCIYELKPFSATRRTARMKVITFPKIWWKPGSVIPTEDGMEHGNYLSGISAGKG
jgi:hypothetical protein